MGPDFLAQAIGLATRNAENGGGPFGAVVVLPDGSLAYGTNQVTHHADPTAHAEVVAIRGAASSIRSHDLRRAVLYASCAPCPMCLAAAMWANIGSIVYAASPEDAAAAGFSDAEFYRQFALATWWTEPSVYTVTPSARLERITALRVTADPREDRAAPFEAWLANPDRRLY